ncbi:TonB-dependent receptor [Mucilaginibacter terrenus]|uniref:TonB-dependent receptor n=1 Tax=Mucilaginibacter terrenus TaxID=2482727 RepID=A0A3E2NW51_9SPHI|nr:TonB-dependent receptor [Mucilaginibacter terrenus]RFZ85235.1 TonB-dependent receptor [Mucilaginibacter terrenus]
MVRKNFTLIFLKFLGCCICFLLANFAALGQGSLKITGRVVDNKGQPLPGVTVAIKSTTTGVSTDTLGKFSIKASSPDQVIVFSMIGFTKQELEIKDTRVFNITLLEDQNSLKEVVVVAYGEQKKESLVSAITTVKVKDLKGPTSNLTTMLAGKISGVVAYQRSGEPGADNAQFFIRGITSFGSGKIDPLILIDGMESTPSTLARLQPDDISGFSILKDAAASSLYGARGANGVILVTTKSGVSGKTQLNFRFENSISQNARDFQLADNITYMELANEAALTRNPLASLPYSQTKIDHTKAGDNPYLYPSNNWMEQLIKSSTTNQRFNMNISGGGNAAQYYVAGTFNQDNGILRSNPGSNFNNNVNLKSYEVRSNVNVKLTSTTEAIIRTSGNFDDYNGPIGTTSLSGGAIVFNNALTANPVLFPAQFPSSKLPNVSHPLFGNAAFGTNGQTYLNPYAEMVSGFQQYNTSTLNVQLELKQDLGFFIKGLSGGIMAYSKRYSYFDVSRKYTPFYYAASPVIGDPNGYNLTLLNEDTATEYLTYKEGGKIVNTNTYGQASLNYTNTFAKKHAVSGLLVGIFRSYLTGNAGDLQSSLPFRNLGLSGRFTYGYDGRYLFETNFGYNGSERFAKNNRFGFFPSVGVAWNVSSEKFFKPLSDVVTRLKLRATYGLVGNDQIGAANDRFFYLSNVNLNDPLYHAQFGENFGYSRNGVSISRYANNGITWEKSQKSNVGMDLELFNSLNLIVDVYKERRTNILMQRSYIPTTLGLTAPVGANVGVAEGKGVDVSMDYNKTFNNAWLQLRGTFTYATSKLLVNEQPDYPSNEQYLSALGYSLNQSSGLIAERLFVDDEDVKNSPKQTFGEVRGGDIKYRDMNGDGQITNLDKVNNLGYPTVPEIVYGFGFSTGYKNFDFSTFFQGSARSSFFIDPTAISPFIQSAGAQTGLLDAIAKDHWSEDNRNIYAFWPRLGSTVSVNNTQPSTWWMRNGSFLRMKSAELAYNFKGGLLSKLHMRSLRLYVNGTNLFVWSGFKLWDPEQGGLGLTYPVQKVYNLGIRAEL